MRFSQTQFLKTGVCALALTSVFLFAGCNRGGTGGGKSGAQASTAAGATAGVDMGAIAYDMLHHKYEANGEIAKMSALEGRRDDFVSAVNRILPSDVSNNLFPTLMSLLPLVDNGYVEGAADDVDSIILELMNDQQTLDSLAKLLNTPGSKKKAGADHSRNQLISRLLAYPDMEELTRSSLRLLRSNDGMDDQGNPNGERNLLRGAPGRRRSRPPGLPALGQRQPGQRGGLEPEQGRGRAPG